MSHHVTPITPSEAPGSNKVLLGSSNMLGTYQPLYRLPSGQTFNTYNVHSCGREESATMGNSNKNFPTGPDQLLSYSSQPFDI
jgi:hypothetical protein